MLLVAELKEIVPARYGFKAVVKHVPDQAFALNAPLYRRLGRHFEPALSLRGASDDIQMVMIATFGVASTGIPTISGCRARALSTSGSSIGCSWSAARSSRGCTTTWARRTRWPARC